MIRWQRTARIKGGKFMEAAGWAKEMTSFAKANFGVDDVQVFVHAFGDSTQIVWSVDYDSLAQLEEVQSKMMGNQEYWGIVKKALGEELFVDGDTRDIVLRGL